MTRSGEPRPRYPPGETPSKATNLPRPVWVRGVCLVLGFALADHFPLTIVGVTILLVAGLPMVPAEEGTPALTGLTPQPFTESPHPEEGEMRKEKLDEQLNDRPNSTDCERSFYTKDQRRYMRSWSCSVFQTIRALKIRAHVISAAAFRYLTANMGPQDPPSVASHYVNLNRRQREEQARERIRRIMKIVHRGLANQIPKPPEEHPQDLRRSPEGAWYSESALPRWTKSRPRGWSPRQASPSADDQNDV